MIQVHMSCFMPSDNLLQFFVDLSRTKGLNSIKHASHRQSEVGEVKSELFERVQNYLAVKRAYKTCIAAEFHMLLLVKNGCSVSRAGFSRSEEQHQIQ